MIEYLGELQAAERIVAALRAVTAEGRVRTPDLVGASTTGQVSSAVIEKIDASRRVGAFPSGPT
jgi:tartrate dehydrogenase/decarboxylase/D-malate dehydrogenase